MIVEEPVRGGFAYLEHPWLLSLPPVEQFAPFLERRVPLAPLYHLAGLRVSDVEPVSEGACAFEMPATPWWRSGAGVFLAGVFPFVADAAFGSAVFTALPPKTGLATSELSMNFLRPATITSERLVARSRVIQMGRSQGLAEARVEDPDGTLLAYGTSRLVRLALPFDPPAPPDQLPAPAPNDLPDDPYRRDPEGEVVSHELLDRASWLDVYRAWIKGELPLPPVCHLTGVRPTDVEDGQATWTMPASQWMCSAFGTFYGGALAVLADAALTGAVGTTCGGRSTFGTLDLKMNFLRPVTPDGRELTARARVVHRGRTIAVATCEVEDAQGRRVAMATSSFMILPGKRWDEREGQVVPIDEASPDRADAGV
ncbi:MAG TPA: PaaI family thioesterase [Actinomycetota bacterium]|nr:PaaI family thioesterase [Actinomycetota bacterium]